MGSQPGGSRVLHGRPTGPGGPMLIALLVLAVPVLALQLGVDLGL